MDEWRNRDWTAVLRGGLLAEAQRWLIERGSDLDAAEREFIAMSVRQQELEREVERRRTRVLKAVTVGAVVAACLAMSLGAFCVERMV